MEGNSVQMWEMDHRICYAKMFLVEAEAGCERITWKSWASFKRPAGCRCILSLPLPTLRSLPSLVAPSARPFARFAVCSSPVADRHGHASSPCRRSSARRQSRRWRAAVDAEKKQIAKEGNSIGGRRSEGVLQCVTAMARGGGPRGGESR